MTETIKDKLAEAEFWTMEAKNYYDLDDEQYELLKQANELVRKAMKLEAAKVAM